jgi:aminoglycoside N3'-acetyltransferase
LNRAIAEVASQLQELGVAEGDTLLVHTSFRAVAPVEGGPEGLILALKKAVGAAGNVVMPSWTGDDDEPFDPASTPAAADLGVVAGTFWRMPDVVRSAHPFAFAAHGPSAAFINRDAFPVPPHVPESPVGRVHELNGKVLLLGVGHDSDTTIHLAELMAGVPYRRRKHVTVWRDGRPQRVDYLENDHCTANFVLADAWLRAMGVQREGRIGNAQSRLVRSRDVVSAVVERLRRDPLLFLHAAGLCAECDEARTSVPGPAPGA